MKVTKIKTAIVQSNFQWTYIRVYSNCDGGLYGTGECFFAPGIDSIIQSLEPILIGEDFNNIEHLVEKMRWACSGAGSVSGVIWNAITGIEAALLDLKGKAHGLPVFQLLGGKFRDTVRIYLDCHGAGSLECLDALLQPVQPAWSGAGVGQEIISPEQIVEGSCQRAIAIRDLGFTALKFDLDVPGSRFDSSSGYSISLKEMDWMIELVQRVRDAVGNDVDLAFDAHWRYRPNDILQVMKEIENCRLMWLEDPIPPTNIHSLEYLHNHTSTAIGTGENLQLREGFCDLIMKDLCDVVTPDLQKAGGLIEGKKIADMAQMMTKPVAPHMIGSPLALMASCHLAVTIPNHLACEFHAYDVPFFHDLVEGGTEQWFHPGWVTPLSKPGFGIELNDSEARCYRLAGTEWFDEG